VTPKVLFIGGTGIISSECVALAVARGFTVSVLNRGLSRERPLPDGVESIIGDATSGDSLAAAIAGRDFDAVADFRAFTAQEVRSRLDLLRDRTGQYLVISSASAYQTPPARLPVVESTPLRNPVWRYSQDKIAIEDLLVAAYREEGYPVTIVRPSHTYDRCAPPLIGGWTQIERMRRGEPVVVHGDGTSLWTLTHSRDFAPGLVGLLANPRTFGEAFHITSDEYLAWNQIFEILAEAAGAKRPRLVHVPSEVIAAADPQWGDALLGDMAHSMVFDNTKVKSLVPGFGAGTPFHVGAREIVAWFDADASRRRVDERLNATIEALLTGR
jgi:nucleoside-diphosphate-sugar epimerase